MMAALLNKLPAREEEFTLEGSKMDSFEKMYSVKEVSGITGWSCDTVRRLIYRGDLKAVVLPVRGQRRKRIYRSARISEGEVKRFLDKNRL